MKKTVILCVLWLLVPAWGAEHTAGTAPTLTEGEKGWVQLWEKSPGFATTNIGAARPEDPGKYFFWGDIRGQYPRNGMFAEYPYNSNISYARLPVGSLVGNGYMNVIAANEHTLTDAHDAAAALWGGRWRLPTMNTFLKMRDKCDFIWDAARGGCIVRGRGEYSRNEIFLPAGGVANDNIVTGLGIVAAYWSSYYRSFSSRSGQATLGPRGLYIEKQSLNFHDLPLVRGNTIRPVLVFSMKKPLPAAVAAASAPQTPPAPAVQEKTGAAPRPAGVPGTTHSRPALRLWSGGPLWATMNVGADHAAAPGKYFWWGDPAGHAPTGKRFSDIFWGVLPISPALATTGKTVRELARAGWARLGDGDSCVLQQKADAARAQWGDGWRLPSREEFQALVQNCDAAWDTARHGYWFTGRGEFAGNRIFLPAGGFGVADKLKGAGAVGAYWTAGGRDFSAQKPTDAPLLEFRKGQIAVLNYARCRGQNIRAVRDD